MRSVLPAAVLFVAFALAPSAVDAQQGRRQAGQPPGERGARLQDRQALETRFRERFRAVVRDRLSASEDQVNKLLEVEQRLGARRFELIRRERDVRREMRAAISAQVATDDAAMAQLITQSIQLQKQRIDLLETEQRELAAFLSPRQRVMYMGLQEQLRRQMEEVRDRREEGGSGVRRPRRPGGEQPGPATLRRPG